jgi:uncharacterized protein (TIGR02594 family)
VADTPDTVSNKLELAKQEKSNTELGAPWIDTAQAEIGQKEVAGAKANPRVMEYHRTAGMSWAEDDDVPWCGSFVGWVMKQHGHTLPANAFRALAWKNFGQALENPAYGAIGFKKRKQGGHVAFIVGQSRDGKSYFMLGGNQKNSVNVSEYSAKDWIGFVFPSNTQPSELLPVYKGNSEKAGSEA